MYWNSLPSDLITLITEIEINRNKILLQKLYVCIIKICLFKLFFKKNPFGNSLPAHNLVKESKNSLHPFFSTGVAERIERYHERSIFVTSSLRHREHRRKPLPRQFHLLLLQTFPSRCEKKRKTLPNLEQHQSKT